MNIITDPCYYNKDAINYIETKYNVSYIFESPIKDKNGNWLERPSLIFYSKKSHPEGSNYLAISKVKGNTIILSNGISTTEPFTGIRAKNGDIIYSHYRHHFNTSEDGSVWIDGGRDYVRTNSIESLISLILIYDKIVENKNITEVK